MEIVTRGVEITVTGDDLKEGEYNSEKFYTPHERAITRHLKPNCGVFVSETQATFHVRSPRDQKQIVVELPERAVMSLKAIREWGIVAVPISICYTVEIPTHMLDE